MEEKRNAMAFDELTLLRRIKTRPEIFFGKKSLLSLRDFLFGVDYGISAAKNERYQGSNLPFFTGFVSWYISRFVRDENGYAAWWNHLLYTSGNDDAYAFDSFFVYFEQYLKEEHARGLSEERQE